MDCHRCRSRRPGRRCSTPSSSADPWRDRCRAPRSRCRSPHSPGCRRRRPTRSGNSAAVDRRGSGRTCPGGRPRSRRRRFRTCRSFERRWRRCCRRRRSRPLRRSGRWPAPRRTAPLPIDLCSWSQGRSRSRRRTMCQLGRPTALPGSRSRSSCRSSCLPGHRPLRRPRNSWHPSWRSHSCRCSRTRYVPR